jgi:divalent metal cation (Fe/Co/Zn/Cd) transporter
METNTDLPHSESERLFKIAFGLAVFTILYNIAEGLLSMYFGFEDESLALFGFGADSFIEVLSGLGIAHMVLRIRRQPHSDRDKFERTALTVTGIAFYILAGGLTLTSTYNLWIGRKPETTLWGVVISIVSIFVMLALMYYKNRIGHQLKSDAILADSECTKVCIYMSIVLLVSSGIYELTRFPFMDILGTLGLAYLSFKEGRECFEKVEKNSHCTCERTRVDA